MNDWASNLAEWSMLTVFQRHDSIKTIACRSTSPQLLRLAIIVLLTDSLLVPAEM